MTGFGYSWRFDIKARGDLLRGPITLESLSQSTKNLLEYFPNLTLPIKKVSETLSFKVFVILVCYK